MEFFGSKYKMAKHFIRLILRGINRRILPKKIARTARRQLNRRYLLFGEFFAELNNPLSPKLANKHAAIEDELNIEGGCYPPRTRCRGGKLPPRSP